MRSSLVISLFALVLISTVSAQKDQYPLNCSKCWSTARSKISECKNLSTKDMDAFGELTDAEIAKSHDKFNAIIPCLCALAESAPTVLENCADSCPPQMADGLATESRIVKEAVCDAPAKKNLETNDDKNSTSGDSAGSGGNSGNNSGNSASTGNDSPNGNSSDASLVQWSGTLVAVIAIMVSAIAF